MHLFYTEQYTNIEEVEIFYASYDVVLLLTKRRFEMEQKIVSKDFLEWFGLDIYKTLIKRYIFDDSNEFEIRFPCYKSFIWNICSDLCTKIF